MRIVKKADERKMEILAAAQQLFFSKGYEGTSVNDIIQATGISKGAFYHHFASKEELLAGLVNLFRDGLIQQLSTVVDSSATALEKLNQIFRITQSEKLRNIDIFDLAFRMLFTEENLKLRTRMLDSTFKVALPLVTAVVTEGVNRGEFTAVKPATTAEFILVLGMYMGEQIAAFVLGTLEGDDPSEVLEEKIQSFEHNVEGMLSLQSGSFIAIERKELNHLYNKVKGDD